MMVQSRYMGCTLEKYSMIAGERVLDCVAVVPKSETLLASSLIR